MGNAHFDTKTDPWWYRDSVEVPFFMHYLKGAPTPALPGALVFETGRHAWRRYAQWPPAETQPMSLTLGAGGTLALCPQARPGAAVRGLATTACTVAQTTTGSDAYVSDPAHPVRFVEHPEIDVPREYMTADQRFAAPPRHARLPDRALGRGCGHRRARLAGAAREHDRHRRGTDADYVVKLVDVFPGADGEQQLVRGEPMRARFRESFSAPKAMVPNAPTRVAYTMPDVNHTFRRGHRIMVQLQSSWFPLTDRNPQTFVPNINFARPADFRPATMRVYRGGAEGSRVDVETVPAPRMP